MAIKLLRPVEKSFPVSQYFGENGWYYKPLKGHPGIDFRCPEFTPVFASADGKVILRKFDRGYGCSIRIQHSFGYTVYAHLNEYQVNLGDTVKMGDIIGLSGGNPTSLCAGRSNIPHLHWGLTLEGISNPSYSNWVDPLPYLTETNPKLKAVDYYDQKLLLRKGWHATFRVRFKNISNESLSNLGLYVRKDQAVVDLSLSPCPPNIEGGSVLYADSWFSDFCAARCSEVKPDEIGEFILDLFAGQYTYAGNVYREDFGIADSEGNWLERFNVWFQVEVI